jgi:hypothetical protein
MKILNYKKIETEITCPKCNFYNNVFLSQIIFQDIIICRGCKSNIRLYDYMNSLRNSSRKIEKTIKRYKKYFHRFLIKYI